MLAASSLTCLEFFAGSGLVRLGIEPDFRTAWANDNCAKKQAVYEANHGKQVFCFDDIRAVSGASLPVVDLAWASFPCQDLSLAGNLIGITEESRSGLFWQWLRVLDELATAGKRPPVLVAENVVGFIVGANGKHFKAAYQAIRERGYRAGALVIDARLFLPQSRPRAFLIAIDESVGIDVLEQAAPSLPFHTPGVVRAANNLEDPEWVWWSLPTPSDPVPRFSDLCERDAPCDSALKTRELLGMLSRRDGKKLRAAVDCGNFLAGTGYRRTRPDGNGNYVQRLELRFDGFAGCLRTPEGGSSRQVVVIVDRGRVQTRLMTVRECARLMGAPDRYALPGSYNDGYRAMGDAVAVPVTRWITRHLLAPLAQLSRSECAEGKGKKTSESAA